MFAFRILCMLRSEALPASNPFPTDCLQAAKCVPAARLAPLMFLRSCCFQKDTLKRGKEGEIVGSLSLMSFLPDLSRLRIRFVKSIKATTSTDGASICQDHRCVGSLEILTFARFSMNVNVYNP